MSENKKYNGWTNYETWCVNLWLTNEEWSYNCWRERAQECFDQTDEAKALDDRRFDARLILADELKDSMEEAMPEVKGLWADLLLSALSEVNWHEIAAAFLDDIDESK
jgi:hypothetical protein